MKDASDQKITVLSRISAFILSPMIIAGCFALLIYISIAMASKDSEKETVAHPYEMLEGDLSKDLKIGMSKAEVIELFGESDTTQSVMTYDLSLPEANEKYILEIKFEKGKLTDFQRQH